MRPVCVSLFSALIFLTLSTQAMAGEKTTLYEKLGGEPVVGKIVYRMLEYAHSDPRIAEKFENTHLERNAVLITEYVCELTDGPCEYTGQEMHKVHYGLDLTSADFNAVSESLQRAMRDYDIPFSVQGKLMARMAPKHHDVIVRSRTGR